jgi:hypothetical protein
MTLLRRLIGSLAVASVFVLLFSGPSFAWMYYTRYRAYPGYQAVDPLPPSGAALGPWKWNFDFGGGPTSVVGQARDQLSSGWNFSVGTGYNFTPRLGLVFEFMDSSLGVTDSVLQRNQALDGDARVWSVTLNPIWRFRIGGPFGGYLIGGGGFYEKQTRLTEPVEVFVPTFHGGFLTEGLADVHQNDDTGGLNVGAGITWNMGWGTKFFVEARYHHLFTSGGGTDLIPVTFGFRW